MDVWESIVKGLGLNVSSEEDLIDMIQEIRAASAALSSEIEEMRPEVRQLEEEAEEAFSSGDEERGKELAELIVSQENEIQDLERLLLNMERTHHVLLRIRRNAKLVDVLRKVEKALEKAEPLRSNVQEVMNNIVRRTNKITFKEREGVPILTGSLITSPAERQHVNERIAKIKARLESKRLAEKRREEELSKKLSEETSE